MPDEPGQAIVPVEQDTVTFYDRQIIAVRLPDGRIAAALRPMCEALQLDRAGQLRRIREDEAIADQLVSVRVDTEGGAQLMEMLTAWAIPTWLTGIKLSRVAPEKRPAILAFKREAADVLYRHFSQRQAELAAPPNLVPAEPITKPEPPERGAALVDWRTYHEAMVAWIDWQSDIEQWRGSMESRLETVEEITRLVPEILERLGPEMLSAEHQRTVHSSIKHLHELTGRAYPTLWTELGASFHVAKYDQIPEARWGEVAEWLRVRITRAGGQAPEQGSLF
ncbi:MAG TPA: phage antirepressor N-terminal domain-containing protein [Ktedonobacterales bacterium]